MWRHRDFLLVWGGQSVSEIGSAITVLALPLAAVVLLDASTYMVRVLHLKPSGVGLVLTLAAVGGMAGGIAAGPLSRRFGSARIIWLAPLVLGLPAVRGAAGPYRAGVSLFYPAGLAGFGMMAVVYNVAQVSYSAGDHAAHAARTDERQRAVHRLGHDAAGRAARRGAGYLVRPAAHVVDRGDRRLCGRGLGLLLRRCATCGK